MDLSTTYLGLKLPSPLVVSASPLSRDIDGICRLEDADYQGHSLAMLRRIANALNKRVELRFVNAKRNPKVA